MDHPHSLANMKERMNSEAFRFSHASFRLKEENKQLTKMERVNLIRGMLLTFADLLTDALVIKEFYEADELFWFILSSLIIGNRTIITAVVGSGVAAQASTNRSCKHIFFVTFYFIIAFLQLNHIYDGAYSLWKGVLKNEFQFTKATTAMMQSIPQSLLQAYFMISYQESSVLQFISFGLSVSSVALSTIESERLMAPLYREGYRKGAAFIFRTCEIAISLAVYGLFAYYAGGFFFLVFIGKFALMALWALHDYKKHGRSIIAIRCGHEVAGMGAVLMAVDFAITAYVPIAILKKRPVRVEDHFFLIGASVPSFVVAILISDVLYGIMSVIILIAYDGYNDEFTRTVYLFLAMVYGLQHLILVAMVLKHPFEEKKQSRAASIATSPSIQKSTAEEGEESIPIAPQRERSESSAILTVNMDDETKEEDTESSAIITAVTNYGGVDDSSRQKEEAN